MTTTTKTPVRIAKQKRAFIVNTLHQEDEWLAAAAGTTVEKVARVRAEQEAAIAEWEATEEGQARKEEQAWAEMMNMVGEPAVSRDEVDAKAAAFQVNFPNSTRRASAIGEVRDALEVAWAAS